MGFRIAMIGSRGVPATFGGIEHHVEQLGSRLAARGHEVTVYCRTNYVPDRVEEYRGMRMRYVAAASSKHLDAIVPTAISSFKALFAGYDIVHYHAIGPGFFTPLSQYASRAKVVQTIHGLDYDRAKWGRAARTFLKTSGWFSGHVPDATVVVSEDLATYYAQKYRRGAVHIPNGVNPGEMRPASEITKRWGLTRGNYIFWVGRIVPEKGLHALIPAFRRLSTDVKLVIGGGSGYADEYLSSLHALADGDGRVIFPGYVYGDTLAELYSNAAAYAQPSTLEGLPLTLLEAASFGAPIVASSIPPHIEILGSEAPGARLCPPDDVEALAGALQRSLANPGAEREGAAKLRTRVLERYSWDEATLQTERVYANALGERRARRLLAAAERQ